MTANASAAAPSSDRETVLVRRIVDDYVDEMVADLSAWLRIPSISADPVHADDIRASAEWLADALRGVGFPTVEIWPTAGAPAVYAEWPSDDQGAPTALVYGHHDVQPVDPLELWESPPFEPAVVGDELRGRGACDCKGQVAFHLLGMRAHLSATGRTSPAVTVKILVEGEEESGSPHFAELLRTNRERLRNDVVVVSDTGMFGRDVPSAVTAMRGLIDGEVHFHGPEVDLHSGVFGGAVPNPLHALAGMIAALHDADGRVMIPGFYDDVRALTDTERALLAKLPFDENQFLTETAQSRALYGEAGYSTLERIGDRPTAEVNGMWGGYTGPGGKTIVPTDAYAKVSFRLVADQDPARIQGLVKDFVAARTPDGITSTVAFHGPGVRPCRTDLEHPATRALVRAMERTFEKEILFTREGGSGPEADLADILESPLVFLGVGLPDDLIHAPNERVRIPLLRKGAEATAYLWSELAALRS